MNSELLLLESLGIEENKVKIITSELYKIIFENKNNVNDIINIIKKTIDQDNDYKTVISAYALSYLIIAQINMEQQGQTNE